MSVLPSPERFGDFLLLQRLSRSAMAEVLLAVRLGDLSGRTFAVKRPLVGERPSGRAAQAIAREAEVLAEVRAPEIVALECKGDIAGLPFLATEHLRGVTLQALIAHAGALPAGCARVVARDLGRAISALAASGWVHGDISPSNVLVDQTGEVRLIDFGLAARAGTKRPEIAGKPGYIAPEAVRGIDATSAEDVYGWGVVVAECALGLRLFPEEDLVHAASRNDGPESLAALEQDIPGITSALKRDPLARPTPEALLAHLQDLALDRHGLAEIAAQAERSESAPAPAARAPSSRALTPTAPMVAKQPQPAGKVKPADRASAQGSRPGPNALRGVVVALAAIGLLAIGFLTGRFAPRGGQTSLAIEGPLPRRAQVELDGRALMVSEGARMPIAPGRHVLAITLPRGEKREYNFTVRPGEQHVLMPLPRNLNSPGREAAEDREP